jgi:hypothetical protein
MHIIFSLKNLFFCYNFVLELYYASIISVRSMLKGKDPDPYLCLMDPDPGSPKT